MQRNRREVVVFERELGLSGARVVLEERVSRHFGDYQTRFSARATMSPVGEGHNFPTDESGAIIVNIQRNIQPGQVHFSDAWLKHPVWWGGKMDQSPSLGVLSRLPSRFVR